VRQRDNFSAPLMQRHATKGMAKAHSDALRHMGLQL